MNWSRDHLSAGGMRPARRPGAAVAYLTFDHSLTGRVAHWQVFLGTRSRALLIECLKIISELLLLCIICYLHESFTVLSLVKWDNIA